MRFKLDSFDAFFSDTDLTPPPFPSVHVHTLQSSTQMQLDYDLGSLCLIPILMVAVGLLVSPSSLHWQSPGSHPTERFSSHRVHWSTNCWPPW